MCGHLGLEAVIVDGRITSCRSCVVFARFVVVGIAG
jgi:hypothetical protein